MTVWTGEQVEGLGWYGGEVGEAEEVDQPDGDHETCEGLLAYEVDGGQVEGEEEADDGHHDPELDTVQQQSSN